MALGGKGYYISLNLSENYFWSVLNICDLVSLLDKHCPVTAFLSHFLNTILASSHTFFGVFPGHAGGKESTCHCRKHKKIWVGSLVQEDLLEKEMATCSSILAWKIPWTEEPGRATVHGPQRVRHDWVTKHTQAHVCFLSSVQSLSCVRLFATPWTAARQASLSITNSQSLLKLMSIESVMPSSHLILCCPLLLPPSLFPSIRVFSDESVLCVRWPEYWSFSFSISPCNEHSGLVSFRVDWLDLLAVQGTLKSLLQHHSSKASILWRSAFFIVQLSHPYMTTGKP